MPDEATTQLFALHNQLVEGHQWVWEELGVRVEYAWSIDPFGCSSTMARLLSWSGVRGLVLQRAHYSWKRRLSQEGAIDFFWAGGIKTRLQPGPGYSVTDSCGPAPLLCTDFDFNAEINDAERLSFHNVHAKSELILGLYGRLGSLSSNNIALVTLGGDFRFENASEWFEQYKNYKAIFDYINGNRNIYKAYLRFGTLKTFFKHVKQSNVTIEGDFFPYADLDADKALAYWTGYYTTRPFSKKLSRTVDLTLRAAEILYTLTLNRLEQGLAGAGRKEVSAARRQYPRLVRARRAAALFQHHDGITGTARARVMRDYRNKLLRALYDLRGLLLVCVELLGPADRDQPSQAEPDANPKRKIVVYNSLPYTKTELIIVKTDNPIISVSDASGTGQVHQVNCICNRNSTLGDIEVKKDIYEVVFVADLPPLSLTSFDMQTKKPLVNYNPEDYVSRDSAKSNIGGLTISNSKLKLTFQENGLISNIDKEYGGVAMKINLNAYVPLQGKSGAYLFQPEHDRTNLYSNKPEGNIIFSDGPLYKEVKAIYGENYVVSTRLYETKGYLSDIVEMKITYNLTESNLELFIEFQSDLKNTKFFTDVNGLEMRERVRIEDHPIGGRYYPVTCLAYLENGEHKLAFLTDHSHGAASLRDGSVEIMLDRRLSADDNRGLEEPVQDNLRTTSTVYLAFEQNTQESARLLTTLTHLLNNPSLVIPVQNETRPKNVYFLDHPLPHHIRLLTLRTLSSGIAPSSRALLVLENTGASSGNTSTFPADLSFGNLTVRSIVRTSLTGVIEEEEELSELSDITVNTSTIQAYKIFF